MVQHTGEVFANRQGLTRLGEVRHHRLPAISQVFVAFFGGLGTWQPPLEAPCR